MKPRDPWDMLTPGERVELHEWFDWMDRQETYMPNVNDMKTSNSRFLTQKDVGKGLLLTITGIEMGNVAAEGAPPEEKWIAHFREHDKSMVLNNTNLDLMSWATEEEDSDLWKGKKIVVYTDPTVMYAGRRTGGLRIRKPKSAYAGGPPADNSDADFDDDLPF